MLARAQGDNQKALSAFQTVRNHLVAKIAERPDDPELLSDLSVATAGMGLKEEARREAEQVVRLVPTSRDAVDGPIYVTRLAQVYAMTGEYDAALRELAEVVMQPRGPSYGRLQFDPVWDDIRADRRFEEILAKAAQPLVIE
jgi:Flp pilus assembly protein TadD